MPASISARLVALALLTAAPVGAQDYGTALQFDGNDRVAFASRDAFNFGTADFTIEFWFTKPDAARETVFTKRVQCAPGSAWAFRADSLLSFGLQQNAQITIDLLSATRIDDGAWHHVAGVRQGVTSRVYIDGVLDAEADAPAVVSLTNTAAVTFGTGPCDPSTFDPSQPFTGAADEVMVWAEARTAAQIAEDRLGMRTGAEPNLLLYWTLDEGTGQVAGDTSPNGVAGQLGTAATPDGADPTWIASGIVAGEAAPEAAGLSLGAPRPNPVGGGAASLSFQTPRDGPVRLSVVDVLGREVAVLVDGARPAGVQAAALDATRLAPGLYIARLTAGGRAVSRAFAVVR
jgi:hypothetical protein